VARIRSIKPEFWVSDQIVECSTSARLLFIGLWNFSDDEGRHAASCKRLKGEVFPCDDFTLEDIRGMVGELIDHGLLELLQTPEGVAYWQVTGWAHQRIDRPTASKFVDGSPIDHRGFVEHSSTARAGVEGSGEERRGEDDSFLVEGSTSKPTTGQPTPSDGAGNGEPEDFQLLPGVKAEAPLLLFPVAGDKKRPTWPLMKNQVTEWESLYPGVDVMAECRKALAYVKANRPKTARGMPSFLVGWLNRSNDRGPSTGGRKASQSIDVEALEARVKAKEAQQRQRHG